MNDENDILKELQEMHSLLAGVPRAMPFSVPGGYFEAFAAITINNINDIATNWTKNSPYTTPAGYFEHLPQAILTEALADDAALAFPKDEVYQIPVNYFDTVPQQILQKANAGEQTAPSQRTIVIKWQRALKWAAAAIVVLGISLGSYKMMNTAPVNTPKALASLPAGTINAYIVQNVDDFETELILNNLSAGKTIKAAGQLNKQEIIQYLNEEGWNVRTEIN